MMETRKKILLVDDEPAILKVLSIKLKVSGYDIIIASDGEEALRLIDSARPDIVLLDIIMPGMDGLQVLERLHARSDLPVIALSARLDNARKALNLGADDFLFKPFDVEEVVRRIDKALESSRQ